MPIYHATVKHTDDYDQYRWKVKVTVFGITIRSLLYTTHQAALADAIRMVGL